MMASNRTAGKKKKKNSNSPPSPQNFQFINFTDAPHVDEYDRDVIRTQAIIGKGTTIQGHQIQLQVR
jgi:hypothetical protein